jgi:hypothetical protein
MSHGIHSSNPQTIWTDGCAECDEHAARLPRSIHDLDDRRRVQAWHYMRAYAWSGGNWEAETPSANDRKLFETLYTIAVFLERAGIGPAEFERRLIDTYDALVARLGGRLTSLKPIGHELDGIDLTGITVAP